MAKHKPDKYEQNEILAAKAANYMKETGVDVQTDPGPYIESAVTSAIRAYVQNIDYKKNQTPITAGCGKIRDLLYGTDLVIQDPTNVIMSRRITRIDITTGCTGKNNMPLITPTENMSLTKRVRNRGNVYLPNGDYFRFGIRIGNGRYGFDAPVIVAGLCSSQEFDPDRFEYAAQWLHENIVENAPKLIRAANMVQNRFYYLTDPKYKAMVDKNVGAEKADAQLPVLVGNWAYLDMEDKYKYSKPSMAKKPRMCIANVADESGRLIIDPRSEDLISRESDIPWMSPMGYLAVTAMRSTPRRIPDQHKRDIIDKILAEPVRDAGQTAAIIIDQDGKPIEKEAKKSAMRGISAILQSAYAANPNAFAVLDDSKSKKNTDAPDF